MRSFLFIQLLLLLLITLDVVGPPLKRGPSCDPLTRLAAYFFHASAFVSTVDLQGILAVPATNLAINTF